MGFCTIFIFLLHVLNVLNNFCCTFHPHCACTVGRSHYLVGVNFHNEKLLRFRTCRFWLHDHHKSPSFVSPVHKNWEVGRPLYIEADYYPMESIPPRIGMQEIGNERTTAISHCMHAHERTTARTTRHRFSLITTRLSVDLSYSQTSASIPFYTRECNKWDNAWPFKWNNITYA